MKFKLSLFLIISLLTVSSISAQKNTFLPYSRYGLGEIVHHGFTTNLGMGGTNTALRIPNQINYLNPASYTIQDTNSFIFDVGLKGSSNYMKTEQANTNKKTLGFDYLAISFPVTTWWNSSLGIVPYSQVGYELRTDINYDYGTRMNEYEGYGGLRKFYIGNAFEPFKNFSIGFNYSYLFGSINYDSFMGWSTDTSNVSPYNIKREIDKFMNASQFSAGLQYTINFSENTQLTIGGSYETSINFDYKENTLSTNLLDTITSQTKKDYNFPMNYSAGLALSTPKLFWGADFTYTNWASLEDFENLEDSYSFQTGIQYTPDKNALRNYFKRINYRLGAYYKNGYLRFNEKNINDYGITFGFGLPLKYNKTKFNLAVLLGRKGTTQNNLIENNYAIINFGVTFYDFWFIQRKYK
jgi:hypothetical protein